MKFGKVEHPEEIDFTLPIDHPDTKDILTKYGDVKPPRVFVGCAKWNKTDLKNFYPKGTKDELIYYSSQFNSIELNATFYRLFPREQFVKWKNKTPDDFKFFPKITQEISHWKRLEGVERVVDNYIHSASGLEEKLGMIFLQMHQNFAPKDFDRVVKFVEYWPEAYPLTIEFRHTDWYNDKHVANELYNLLIDNGISSTVVETAGRRDLVHMRLSSPYAFIRWTGANHESDYTRLDDWVERLALWTDQGINDIYFFVHQNMELESPLLAGYFIEKLNKVIGSNLRIPETQQTLF